MDPQSLSGEIAIVTGSDSGIGQATAFALARAGADVALREPGPPRLEFPGPRGR